MKKLVIITIILAVVAAAFMGAALIPLLSAGPEEVTPPKAIATPEPTPEPTPTPTPEPTPEPTPTPEPEKGTFGEKFAHLFAEEGEAFSGENYYRSNELYVVMTKHSEENLTYSVADIYIRDITNFRTAFSRDRYNAKSEPTIDQALRAQAVTAMSGDFYSIHEKGLVVRNGEIYRNMTADWDIGVLFSDGTFKTYTPEETEEQIDAILEAQPWQSWCFGPKLLTDGQPMTEFNSTVKRANPRNAIGYYEPGHYCFVNVDGRQGSYSQGLDMEGLSNLMYSLRCVEAYNLDGGATAAITWNGEVYNRPSGGGRGVSDILYVADGMLDAAASQEPEV